MTYQDALTSHLIAYKHAHLGSPIAGTFRYRGAAVQRDHILPVADKWLNLMEDARGDIQSFLSANPRVRTHQYFHHLNSSQGFALNLFVPFFEGGVDASRALLKALGQRADLVGWEPEAIPDKTRATNFDALWDTTDGVRTFCEVKLSERDFGKARNDARHLKKLRNIYLPVLAPHLDPGLRNAPEFFRSYQILRNIWHMIGVPKSRIVFLIPRANGKLWKLLDATLAQVARPVRDRTRAVAIEDVISELLANPRCTPNMRAYAARLREKYVPS